MNVANPSCLHCAALPDPNQTFCTNCGKPYSKPIVPERECTSLAQSSSSYGTLSLNGTPAVYQEQSSTTPPSNVEYAPASASDERAIPGEYRQQPFIQEGDVQTPQPKRRSKTGLFIGISGPVVMLLLVGTGFFLFTKSKGNIGNFHASSLTPAVPHLNITPFTDASRVN